LQRLPLRFFDTKKHGELMSRSTNDIDNISNALNQTVSQVISSVLTVIGALAIMLSLNVWLTLLCLVTFPLTITITKKIAGFTRRHFAKQQQSLCELNGFIEETVSGQKVVVTFCREERAAKDFNAFNQRLKTAAIKAQISTGVM